MKNLILVSFLAFTALSGFGQNTKSETLFVPKEHVQSFQKAISRFADCYERHDRECIYDLTYKPRIEKSEFVSKQSNNLFYDFSTLKKMNLLLSGKYIDPIEGVESWFSIQGCLEFAKGKPHLAETQAYLIDGKWFFGGFMPWAFPRGVKDSPCKMEDYARERNLGETKN